MQETLRKLIFVQVHDWYESSLCETCVEFNYILLPEGATAFCNRVENDKPCRYRKRKTEGERENSSTSPLLKVKMLQRESK
jgi:hypothetical protein